MVSRSRSRIRTSSIFPVITIAQAKQKADAMADLARWKAKHPDLVPLLAPEHVIVDTNRGRATAWYRVRINLTAIPEAQRPPQETPDPDYDVKTEWADLAKLAEDLRELPRRRDLELIVPAVRRWLVWTPALEVRAVAKPIALHVIVRDLGDALDAQRHPR